MYLSEDRTWAVSSARSIVPVGGDCVTSSAVEMSEASTLAATLSSTSCFGPVGSVRTVDSVFSVGVGTPFGEVDSATLVSAGVVLDGVATDCRSRSRFFSSVRRKAFKVVRRALLGLHKSGATGVWVQTGHVLDSEAWPGARKLAIV